MPSLAIALTLLKMRFAFSTMFTFAVGALLTLTCLGAEANEPTSITKEANAFRPANAKLGALYRTALLNIDSPMTVTADQTIFVKTGDIPAEWLRDSSAQARPYLHFAKKDPGAAALLRAIIARQMKSLGVDPYANAFNEDYSIWEEKFELDSLAYPILFARDFWKTTGDRSIFTSAAKTAFTRALETMELEQDHAANSTYTHEELKRNPVAHTGMIWTGFRPSDDACEYNFLIPSEMMAAQALEAIAEISRTIYHDAALAVGASKLAREVRAGIEKYGIVTTQKYGRLYAYEVDGFGHSNLMDDANLPSLLSAPYFGYVTKQNMIYKNTRRFILSRDNPYFYEGRLASGVGSPHTPAGMIWPLALLARGLTSNSARERREVLRMLLASDNGDHRLRESFNPNDPNDFTRADFGWPNSLFTEFIMKIYRR